MSLVIRPVEQCDAAALQKTCWPEVTLFDVETRLIDVTTRPAAWGTVAEYDGEVVGYGQLVSFGRRVEISDLIVSEGLRGCGVGTALIKHLLRVARAHQLTLIEIGAAVSNPRALALYRRLGFEDVRTVTLNLGQGDEPVIYLEKHLA